MDPKVCVVIHDVAPATWEACQRVIAAVGAVGPVPFTFLAVPRYHSQPRSPSFERDLGARVDCGDELALHGYFHQDDGVPRSGFDKLRRRWYTAGEGEFSALSREEASQRLAAGIRWFADNRWPLHGFVAPAWLMSDGTWQALGELAAHSSLSYTSTLRHVYALGAGSADGGVSVKPRTLTSQSHVYSTRAGWRRACSVAWNRTLASVQTDTPLIRFELHPHDADYPGVLRNWQQLLAKQLERRKAVTVEGFVREWMRDEPVLKTAAA
jgi:predicted deacetylase